MKLRNPAHEVRVLERNPAGVTFGWGVVLSDETLDNLRNNDPESAQEIQDSFAHWDDVEVHVRGKETIRSGGHGFVGIGRKHLLDILAEAVADAAPDQASSWTLSQGSFWAARANLLADERERDHHAGETEHRRGVGQHVDRLRDVPIGRGELQGQRGPVGARPVPARAPGRAARARSRKRSRAASVRGATGTRTSPRSPGSSGTSA